jgi:hypothetical protein
MSAQLDNPPIVISSPGCSMAHRNLTKPFSIAGIILGEIYMVFTVFGPSPTGEVVPLGHQLWRMLALFPFFGIFGALVAMGIGLLVSSLLPPKR